MKGHAYSAAVVASGDARRALTMRTSELLAYLDQIDPSLGAVRRFFDVVADWRKIERGPDAARDAFRRAMEALEALERLAVPNIPCGSRDKKEQVVHRVSTGSKTTRHRLSVCIGPEVGLNKFRVGRKKGRAADRRSVVDPEGCGNRMKPNHTRGCCQRVANQHRFQQPS